MVHQNSIVDVFVVTRLEIERHDALLRRVGIGEDDVRRGTDGREIDVKDSMNAWQMERGGQWDKGKSYDTFAPIGPWLLTADDVPDPHTIDLWLEVNGQRVQNGSTRHFIFGVPTVVSYISQFMTLEPGDVILTGTPAGVGLGQKPAPWFLKPGDVMRLGATGLGEQMQKCVGG